jgi:hypothetical protein
MRMHMTAEGQAEPIAQNAVRAEEAGELESASEKWSALAVKNKDSDDLEARTWGLLGEKKFSDLQRTIQRQEGLKQELDKARNAGQEYQPSQEAEKLVVRAIHFEEVGDWPLALKRWEKLKEMFHDDWTGMRWGVLAAKKVNEIKPKIGQGIDAEKKARVERVRERLNRAKDIIADDPRANVDCFDIVNLYENDPDPELAILVTEAKRVLVDHPFHKTKVQGPPETRP